LVVIFIVFTLAGPRREKNGVRLWTFSGRRTLLCSIVSPGLAALIFLFPGTPLAAASCVPG
jgi:hypothetical protein